MKTLKWGLLYTAAFLAAFVGSALLKINSDPTHGKYNTRWDETIGKAYTDLPYGEGAANKFDLYVPADKSQDAYGLVVYLHAGGFTGGDKAGDAEMLKWLCSKGYVAAGINYTLFTEENPDASVYSQSEEIKAAMPSVVAAAEKLGYKLDRMAISGGSAGGCLALIYAYRDADTSPLPVRMVFEAVGPGSFHVEDWGIFGLDQSPEAAAGLFSVMSGQALTPEDITSGAYLEAVKPISADRWVTKDTVPSVLCYGAHDKMQPFAASKPLVAALEKNGVDYRYFVAKHSGHGLQNDNKVYMEYLDAVVEYLDKYMKDMDAKTTVYSWRDLQDADQPIDFGGCPSAGAGNDQGLFAQTCHLTAQQVQGPCFLQVTASAELVSVIQFDIGQTSCFCHSFYTPYSM